MNPADILSSLPNFGMVGAFVYVVYLFLEWIKDAGVKNAELHAATNKRFDEVTERFTTELRACRSEFQGQIHDVTDRLITGLADNAKAMSELKSVIHDLDGRIANQRVVHEFGREVEHAG